MQPSFKFWMDTPLRKISTGCGSGHLISLLLGPLVAAPEPAVDHVNDSINSVNTIAIKLPELWKSHVRGWFALAETQIAMKGILDQILLRGPGLEREPNQVHP